MMLPLILFPKSSTVRILHWEEFWTSDRSRWFETHSKYIWHAKYQTQNTKLAAIRQWVVFRIESNVGISKLRKFMKFETINNFENVKVKYSSTKNAWPWIDCDTNRNGKYGIRHMSDLCLCEMFLFRKLRKRVFQFSKFFARKLIAECFFKRETLPLDPKT